jgi:hypothetical protein
VSRTEDGNQREHGIDKEEGKAGKGRYLAWLLKRKK